jgi:hypothetical protein
MYGTNTATEFTEWDKRSPVNKIITEAKFLDEIQTKSEEFPPCYSQSPLQFCFEISISSNSHNLLQFLQFRHYTL